MPSEPPSDDDPESYKAVIEVMLKHGVKSSPLFVEDVSLLIDAATLRADRAEEALERAMKVVEEAKTAHFVNVRDRRCRCTWEPLRPCALGIALDALDADQEAAE